MNKCEEIKSNLESKFGTTSIDFDDLLNGNGNGKERL